MISIGDIQQANTQPDQGGGEESKESSVSTSPLQQDDLPERTKQEEEKEKKEARDWIQIKVDCELRSKYMQKLGFAK